MSEPKYSQCSTCGKRSAGSSRREALEEHLEHMRVAHPDIELGVVIWVLVFSDVESDHLWRDDLEAVGLDYVRTGAWIKTGSTPQFSGDRPATGFEAITIAHPKGRKRWNGGGLHALWKFPEVAEIPHIFDVPIVLNRSGKEPRFHTTQKPFPLMSALVELFSEPGEVVLDPTAGSGTTGVAAKRHARRSILIEQSEAHCESIVTRLKQETPLDIFEPTDEATPLFDGVIA